MADAAIVTRTRPKGKGRCELVRGGCLRKHCKPWDGNEYRQEPKSWAFSLFRQTMGRVRKTAKYALLPPGRPAFRRHAAQAEGTNTTLIVGMPRLPA